MPRQYFSPHLYLLFFALPFACLGGSTPSSMDKAPELEYYSPSSMYVNYFYGINRQNWRNVSQDKISPNTFTATGGLGYEINAGVLINTSIGIETGWYNLPTVYYNSGQRQYSGYTVHASAVYSAIPPFCLRCYSQISAGLAATKNKLDKTTSGTYRFTHWGPIGSLSFGYEYDSGLRTSIKYTFIAGSSSNRNDNFPTPHSHIISLGIGYHFAA